MLNAAVILTNDPWESLADQIVEIKHGSYVERERTRFPYVAVSPRCLHC